MIRTGRFAPSPTGPLHAGSLVAALASWLDLRARGPQARWLVRIEDADTERCLPGMGEHILSQLAACGLVPDETPTWQTQRTPLYERALDRLKTSQLSYPCGCSRKDIDEALARSGAAHRRHGERVYPGTCRDGLHGKPARAWRFATAKFEGQPHTLPWTDRRLGEQQQDVAHEVGDFVLKRADGPWAYQLAVVVDDADQGVTDVGSTAAVRDGKAHVGRLRSDPELGQHALEVRVVELVEDDEAGVDRQPPPGCLDLDRVGVPTRVFARLEDVDVMSRAVELRGGDESGDTGPDPATGGCGTKRGCASVGRSTDRRTAVCVAGLRAMP